MQYFDIYIDSMKGIYTYSDKNDEFEVSIAGEKFSITPEDKSLAQNYFVK